MMQPIDNMYPLLPKQNEASKLHCKYRLYWWARWGWKSYWLRSEVAKIALSKPGLRWLVLRRTFPEVEWNTIVPLLWELPAELYTYNSSKWVMTFINNTTVKFSYCRNYQDVIKYQWIEYDFIAIEELTHWTYKEWRFLMGSLRSTKWLIEPNFFATTNPGWIWHSWVKRLWITRSFEKWEYPNEYWFVQAFVYDNPILMELDPTYVQSLESLPDTERRAFLEWDWDVFQWQFFKEFRREVHVTSPYIPLHWKKIIALDYWYSAPSAVYWMNKSPHWKITIYRELYITEHTYKQLALRIKALTWANEKIEVVVVDPAILHKRNESDWLDASEIMQPLLDWKIIWANNTRNTWWTQMRTALQIFKDWNSWKNNSILEICENCRDLIRTLPEQVHDQIKVEDLDTKWEDHACDAVRYGLMYLWVDKWSFADIKDINEWLMKEKKEKRKSSFLKKKDIDYSWKTNILKEDF